LDDPARRKLATAQTRIAEGQLEEADEILSGLQATNSDFLPAYSERAALFEKRGDSEQARTQWMEILRRAKDAESPETHRAASALSRMTLEEFPRHPPKPPPPAARQVRSAPDAPEERIAILSAEVRRLPPSPDAEDVRILELQLELTDGSPSVPMEEVSVVVRFYDRTDPDGRVRPSSIRNNPQTRTPGTGVWKPGTAQQVTAPYVVPRGMREQDTRAYGARTSYYGYSIEVRVGKTVRARLHRPAQLETAIYGRR
jgi:tetratricopeptide (TPR) repeat protein